MKIDKTWKLPKPEKTEYGYDWKPVVRVGRVVPFGYKQDENDRDILLPIPTELELLEKAKKYIRQYSYRQVANWLSKESGRYISHVGLKKRIQVERKRKKAATIKRKLATRLEKTLQEIQKLEQETTGSSTEVRA